MNKTEQYYRKVANHFDEDARLFEQRYEENPVLQKIRWDFRNHTEKFTFSNALEIGCGPGIDMVHFCKNYPDKNIYGIDVSEKMVSIAQKNLEQEKLSNGVVKQGSVEDIPALFPGKKFDLIFVYFGGLNTVYDLKATIKTLREVVTDNATFILTNVNRYYVMDVFIKLLKLKFSEMFARFQNRWKGYSPGRDLPSNVYSYNTIKQAVEPEFKIIHKRGYSILYPPWYASGYLKKLSFLEKPLWKFDELLQKSPFWNNGEYSLYILKAQPKASEQ